MRRLELDYCSTCDFPTFNHEEVVLVRGEFRHMHCVDDSVRVTKRENLTCLPLVEPTE